MASRVDKIISRQARLEDRKVRWEQLYRDIGTYILPLMEDALGTFENGVRKGNEIYDGSATFSLNTLVKMLYGKMVNPASTWFKLRFRTEELNELPEVKEWLQFVERHLYNVFQDSNFYDSIEGFLRDGAAFGTAVMFIEENPGEGRLNYMNINLNQCYIDQDFHGNTDTLHRRIRRMTAKQMFDFFKKETPQEVVDTLDSDPFAEYEVINAVAPRALRDPGKIDSKNKPWESIWVLRGVASSKGNSDRAGRMPTSSKLKVPMEIRESGFDRFPYIVWRWETDGVEEYGRAPGMYALADAMGINLMGKTMLDLAELAVNPPMNVMEGTEESVNFLPRGLNVLENPEKAPFPVATGAGSNYPIGIDQMERKSDAIRRHFYVDALNFLESIELGKATATEIVAREGENAVRLGSLIGKLSGALDQIIDTTFDKEYEAGRIPEPPLIVAELEGGQIDTVYTGPLAQAQRRFFETGGINNSLETVAGIARLDQSGDVLRTIDWEEVTRIQLEANGFPQKAIRTREDVDAMREQDRALQAQMMQAEQAQVEAKAIKDLATADKDSGGKVSEAIEEGQV